MSMRMVFRAGLWACAWLLAAVPAAADPAADAVCRRLLPDAAIAADLGPGYSLRDLTEDGPTWRCLWEAGPDSDRRRLNVGFQPTADSARAFNDFMTRMKRSGTAVEPLTGVGSAASILTFGTSFIVGGRTAGAFFSVGTTNLTRGEVSAIAMRLGQVSEATIAAARAALADARAHPGAPAPPLADVIVRRAGQRLPCEQLLPREDIVAVLGDTYHLTYVNDPRPDFSTCEWKRTEKDYAVTFMTRGPAEFRDAQLNGPSEYFAAELRMANCSSTPGNGAVAGIGLDTRVCGQGRHFTALIRRTKDVLTLICPDCTREQVIALARAAVQ
jgi:hypothetical protein